MNKTYNILIVDDDLKNIQVGINFLKQNENYHLIYASSGHEALERMKEVDFDLILLDIIMPVMDGFEVCKRIKEDEKNSSLPVIFLTAKTEVDDLLTGFKLGGADYITKPFHAPELNARVKTHLELHHFYKTEIDRLNRLLIYSQQIENVRFLARGVAHDCNNFLGTIPLNLRMLEKKLDEHGIDDYDSFTKGIYTAVENTSNLISHLAAYTKKEEIIVQQIDLNEVVDNINEITSNSIPHTISCSASVLYEPVFVTASKIHIEQVLLNLIINSQHAIEEVQQQQKHIGIITLTVNKPENYPKELKETNLSYLSISVEDNGGGIPPETLDHIFDPYYTTRKEKGGSGLGLAVSKEIISAYGGTISVSSKEGEGAAFIIYLPESSNEK
jgi:two-component system, sensor histidine kinase and response regulator